jgi:hypothetical protein
MITNCSPDELAQDIKATVTENTDAVFIIMYDLSEQGDAQVVFDALGTIPSDVSVTLGNGSFTDEQVTVSGQFQVLNMVSLTNTATMCLESSDSNVKSLQVTGNMGLSALTVTGFPQAEDLFLASNGLTEVNLNVPTAKNIVLQGNKFTSLVLEDFATVENINLTYNADLESLTLNDFHMAQNIDLKFSGLKSLTLENVPQLVTVDARGIPNFTELNVTNFNQLECDVEQCLRYDPPCCKLVNFDTLECGFRQNECSVDELVTDVSQYGFDSAGFTEVIDLRVSGYDLSKVSDAQAVFNAVGDQTGLSNVSVGEGAVTGDRVTVYGNFQKLYIGNSGFTEVFEGLTHEQVEVSWFQDNDVDGIRMLLTLSEAGVQALNLNNEVEWEVINIGGNGGYTEELLAILPDLQEPFNLIVRSSTTENLNLQSSSDSLKEIHVGGNFNLKELKLTGFPGLEKIDANLNGEAGIIMDTLQYRYTTVIDLIQLNQSPGDFDDLESIDINGSLSFGGSSTPDLSTIFGCSAINLLQGEQCNVEEGVCKVCLW